MRLGAEVSLVGKSRLAAMDVFVDDAWEEQAFLRGGSGESGGCDLFFIGDSGYIAILHHDVRPPGLAVGHIQDVFE